MKFWLTLLLVTSPCFLKWIWFEAEWALRGHCRRNPNGNGIIIGIGRSAVKGHLCCFWGVKEVWDYRVRSKRNYFGRGWLPNLNKVSLHFFFFFWVGEPIRELSDTTSYTVGASSVAMCTYTKILLIYMKSSLDHKGIAICLSLSVS